MNRIKLLVMVLTVAGALTMQAQNAPGGGQGGGGGASVSDSVDDQLRSLTTQLTLSKDQQVKAKAILEEKQKMIQGVRDQYPVAKAGDNPSQEGRTAMGKVMATIHNKMLEILNDEQKKTFDKTDAITPDH